MFLAAYIIDGIGYLFYDTDKGYVSMRGNIAYIPFIMIL